MSGTTAAPEGAGTMPAPFGARLAAAMTEHGPLCAGIDPHPTLLAQWGLADDADGLRRFALTVVDALGGHVAALKPQSALFERHGSAGVAVLEDVIASARAHGTLTIVDAKRGDIGSTMTGYAHAYLVEGSPLAGDALTVSPYLGFGSLTPAVDIALANGRGLFVLCLTSNPEGRELQHARGSDGQTVASLIAQRAGELNTAELGAATVGLGGDLPGVLGSIGLVVGATIGDAAAEAGVDLPGARGPLLAPGVGAQGAGAADLAAVFGAARSQVLASSSRGVLAAGPDQAALLGAARRAADEAASALSVA